MSLRNGRSTWLSPGVWTKGAPAPYTGGLGRRTSTAETKTVPDRWRQGSHVLESLPHGRPQAREDLP